LERNRPAIAETKEVGAVDIQMLQQYSRVVGRLFETERPILDITRASVPLLFERDDPPVAGKDR
jgi:hypothetical protein